jgi:hypothetical protein
MSRNFERVICKSVFAVGLAFASVFAAQAQVLGAPPEANQFEDSRADTSDVSSTILSAQSNHDPLQSKQADPFVQKDNDDMVDALQADDKQVVASVYHNGRVKKIKYGNHDRRHHMRERGHRNERHHDEGGRHHRGRHHSS